MDTSHGRAAVRSALTLAVAPALLLAALAVGCRTDPASNPFLARELSTPRAGSVLDRQGPVASEPLDPGVLASDDWFEQPPASYADRGSEYRRWHHPHLEGHLHPEAPQSDLSAPLASTNPVVATNAAIVVAYWGAGDSTEHLTAAIRATKLPLPLRCAAAEALGHLEQPAPTLRDLLREAGDFETPDLRAALIRSLARHAEPGDEQWFNAALTDGGWQVRLEGVAAWAALPDLTLPQTAVELRRDRDPRVRATALHTIAAHRDPRAVSYLQEGLDDTNIDVRVAAVSGLRDIGTADAKALLGRLQDRGAELQQAAAFASQAAEGLRDDVQAAAGDAQAQLRQAVAERLDSAEQQGRTLAAETAAQAQQTVRQASAQVEQTVGQARQTAQSAAERIREIQQLVDSVREANLPEAARREAATALERMAMDAELEVRVRAARAMGELADPLYLPSLMVLLSDEAAVQAAALASLVQIAGRDVSAGADDRPLSNEEKVLAWQLWYRERQNAAGRR